MRGDVVFRIYGIHAGRAQDFFWSALRTRAEAESVIEGLHTRIMHGANWAAKYHDQGFVIREHIVDTDFEIPPRPAPRDVYLARTSEKPNAPGTWSSTEVEVLARRENKLERVATYERDYAMLQTFEPFRQGKKDFALVAREYTKTAVMDLASGKIIAEEIESSPGSGFCPIGFYVPDWWDVNDESVIPGSEYWNAGKEWPIGEFGFVWGCYWGDDSSWKLQYLDLRRIEEGVIARDERFGQIKLAVRDYASPCIDPPAEKTGTALGPDFIRVSRNDKRAGAPQRARFSLEVDFDLETGAEKK